MSFDKYGHLDMIFEKYGHLDINGHLDRMSPLGHKRTLGQTFGGHLDMICEIYGHLDTIGQLATLFCRMWSLGHENDLDTVNVQVVFVSK